MYRRLSCVCFLVLVFFNFVVSADVENFDPTNLSIEQLMDSQVTSVSRTEQKFSDSAAAVYVITQDDIQRSGVSNIPDALRMVPGVQVARISSNEWAVTARGFNGRFANKLLVLLDGRTVYTATFAGVRWENLDVILDDIERIEVIRGPGASVWGHNAVNGVINIITKHTEDTQQGLVSVTAGNEEQPIVELRYGDQLGDSAHYRLYGKYLRRNEFVDLQGANSNDDWTQGRGGFRVDWNPQKSDRFMLEGDGFFGEFNESFLSPTDDQFSTPTDRNTEQNSGASALARWEHDLSVSSKTKTQFYYEYYNEIDPQFSNEKTHTFDIDFQHDIALRRDNYFNWGLGYRFLANSFSNSQFLNPLPNQKSNNLHLVSAFIQDKVVFFEDKVHLTFGTKIQYFTLSGWDYQPSARLLWKIHPEHRVWASFSRSTRSPSLGETSLALGPLDLPASPLPVVFQGNPEFDEEQVYSYELGYRGWVGNRFSFDLAFFYNEYEDLFAGADLRVDSGNIIASIENSASAKTWGIETAVDWRPIDSLRLQLSYSFLQINFQENSNSTDQEIPQNDPKNQFSFRGSYDISSSVDLDVWVRYVGSIQSSGVFGSPRRNIDDYVGLDLRLAWKPMSNLELSVIGQNLNNRSHLEYVEEFLPYPKQIERSFYGKVKWSF